MNSQQDLPTFQQLCRQHQLSWQQILDDLDATINQPQAFFFFQFGKGYLYVVEACLTSFSRLCGRRYTRQDIRCEIWDL